MHHGKQDHSCQDCGRQFVKCFAQYLISDEPRALIEPLLVERISLRGICCAVGVRLKWLLGILITGLRQVNPTLPLFEIYHIPSHFVVVS